MLFAPLIVDLDGRINLNTAGNIKGNTASRSNSGWFASEVNLSMLWSTSATNSGDWLYLFTGNGTAYGKYGRDQVPSGTLFASSSPAHIYGQGDLDGSNEQANGTATAPFLLPARVPPPRQRFPFPYFPPGYGSGSPAERQNHPAAYSVFKSMLATPGNDDLVFRPSDMEALLRPNNNKGAAVDSGSSALISYLTHLCPDGLRAGAAITQRRNWITTLSADVVKPGLSPWIYDPTNPSPYLVQAGTPLLSPTGVAPLPFPSFMQRQAPRKQRVAFQQRFHDRFAPPHGGPGPYELESLVAAVPPYRQRWNQHDDEHPERSL